MTRRRAPQLEPGWASCAFCGEPVRMVDTDTWRQVTVWVGGKKAHGSTLQGTDSLAYAHQVCVKMAKAKVDRAQTELPLHLYREEG